MKNLGYCRNDGAVYMVCWFPGDRITIPALGTLIATDTHDREKALDICRRNFKNFVAF